MVATDGARKLAALMTAGGTADIVSGIKDGHQELDNTHLASAELLAATLAQAWALEGLVLDQVSDAWERGDPPEDSRAAVVEHLERLQALAGSAIESLSAKGAAGDPPAHE